MAANQDPETLAAAAALLLAAKSATLATVNEGQPHAALVTPALDADGGPLLLLSTLAVHTKHLLVNPACALLVLGTPRGDNPQTTPRLCLSGIAHKIQEDVRAVYLKAHPYAAQYVDFGDFSFWKITVSTSQYVGGFANAAHLNVAALQHEISARLFHS